MTDEAEILGEQRGQAGVVTLNRPHALNALTLGMVRSLRALLDRWAGDPAVTRVVVAGAGERAFCAGGDVRRLYELGLEGRRDEQIAFWREEYQLNVLIKRYPKPYVALIDGIVMGGGVGLSLHGSHRIAGDRTVFAMPEVGIGFFPDVGATYALPRLPGCSGRYLALTGERLRAADAVALGLANRFVPSARQPELREALIAGEGVDAAILSLAVEPESPAPLERHRTVIDACFAADTVEGVLERLDGAASGGSDFAAATAATIRQKSPTSLKLALEQVRLGAGLTFEEAMRLEFRIVSRIRFGHDFPEGVRAALVDRDNAPRWRPATLGEVASEAVAEHLAPLPDGELDV